MKNKFKYYMHGNDIPFAAERNMFVWRLNMETKKLECKYLSHRNWVESGAATIEDLNLESSCFRELRIIEVAPCELALFL